MVSTEVAKTVKVTGEAASVTTAFAEVTKLVGAKDERWPPQDLVALAAATETGRV